MRDISRRCRVGNSPVLGVLRSLPGKELINSLPCEVVVLTTNQKQKNVVRCHEVLRDFFMQVLSVVC